MKFRNTFVSFLSIIICAFFIQFTAFAAEVETPSAVFDNATGIATITGTHPLGEGAQATVSVTKDGETEVYYWFGTAATAGGNFEFKFKMNRQLDLNGVYKVKLGGAGLTAVSTQYSFYVPADETDILTTINSATVYTDVQAIIETKGESFGVDNADAIFDTLINKSAVYESLMGRDFTSTGEVKKAFYMSCAAQQLNEALSENGASLLPQYSNYLNLDINRKSTFQRVRSDACKALVYSEFIGNNLVLKEAESLADKFEKSAALAVINDVDSSNRSSLITMIEEFNGKGYSDISLTEYNAANFDDLETLNVASLVIAAKDESYFTSFDAVETALKKACEDTVNARTGAGSDDEDSGDDLGNDDGGSGGGFGGGGGGKVKENISVSKDIVESIQIEKDTETETVIEFSDLDSSHWAYNSIKKLVSKNIVSGTGENAFEPDRNIKREEFVKILVGSFSVEEASEEVKFDDVASDDWYYPYIKDAFAKGIINGVGENSFGVGRTITREDLATMVYRVLDASEVKLEAVNQNAKFSDMDFVSDYAKDAVNYLYKVGIINGISETEFAPKATATRAMAAKIIATVMERGGIN